MKSIVLVFLVTTFFTLPLQAEDSFPEIGKSYEVGYSIKPEDSNYGLRTVKILRKGSGGWVFVQGRRFQDGDLVSLWLNFDHLLAAREIQEAEQGAPSNR